MTKVFQIFEEEKQEALRNALQEKNRETVEKLLKIGTDIKNIMYVTDLTEEEIKKIQESMLVAK